LCASWVVRLELETPPLGESTTDANTKKQEPVTPGKLERINTESGCIQ
jgi:hypothetical protein